MFVYKNKQLFLILALLLSATLGACSSHKSELKSYMKCGIAANQLGEHRAAQEISNAAEDYISKNSESLPLGSPYAQASLLGQEVRDDLNLEAYDFESQVKKLVKIYNSSTCQKMHTQGVIS